MGTPNVAAVVITTIDLIGGCIDCSQYNTDSSIRRRMLWCYGSSCQTRPYNGVYMNHNSTINVEMIMQYCLGSNSVC